MHYAAKITKESPSILDSRGPVLLLVRLAQRSIGEELLSRLFPSPLKTINQKPSMPSDQGKRQGDQLGRSICASSVLLIDSMPKDVYRSLHELYCRPKRISLLRKTRQLTKAR